MNIKIDHSQEKTIDCLGADFETYRDKAAQLVQKVVKAGIGETNWGRSDAAKYIMDNFSDNEILYMAVCHVSDLAEKHIKTTAFKAMLSSLGSEEGVLEEDEFEEEVKKLLSGGEDNSEEIG